MFLYHAIKAGMTMGIVNAGMMGVYDDISIPSCASASKTWCSTRREDATERMIEDRRHLESRRRKQEAQNLAWREGTVQQRLSHALVHGITQWDRRGHRRSAQELLHNGGRPIHVIEGSADGWHERGRRPVRPGQNVLAAGGQVGARDEAGGGPPDSLHRRRKTAGRKDGTGIVAKPKGKIVIATVKGDVHDIGKNIVSVVLQCNNFEVVNMGVMVPCSEILARAKVENADMIGLSGLITPSLGRDGARGAEMQRDPHFRMLKIPLLIGGATTSRAHTAVKIAHNYEGPVVYVPDASRSVSVASSLLLTPESARTVHRRHRRQDYDRIREQHANKQGAADPAAGRGAREQDEARWASFEPVRPKFIGRRIFKNVDLAPWRDYIDWGPFFQTWDLAGPFPAILTDEVVGEAARSVFEEGQALLKKHHRRAAG